jgi:hypothetical protein
VQKLKECNANFMPSATEIDCHYPNAVTLLVETEIDWVRRRWVE